MYIAFKWLVCLALAMWIVLCSIDLYKKNTLNLQLAVLPMENHITTPIYKNVSRTTPDNNVKSKQKLKYMQNLNQSAYLHYVMFFAGICIASILNRKNEIMLYTKMKIKTLNTDQIRKCIRQKIIFLKNTATFLSDTISKFIEYMKKIQTRLMEIKFSIYKPPVRINRNMNLVLLNKIRILNQERKNLGHLLIAALQENKNIRMKFQLESMTKNRLTRYIEDSQLQVKDSRSRYVNFQQLYLKSHQENTYLKSRLRKVTAEKEDAERNLVELVNQVCLSKNDELKNFCSRFIVQTKHNLLNSDVKREIQEFLRNSNKKNRQNTAKQDELDSLKPVEMSEILDEENLLSLVKDSPRFRGLPGEYVWTIKDKNGIIEKLYEYDTDFDNGDTIRRIREYSVYYDKECLLDFSNSTTFMRDSNASNFQNQRTDCCIASERFLTGSRAFQQFLQTNKSFTLRRTESLAIAHRLGN